MGEWAKVVTHPLGLAGFALFTFLVFLTWRRTSFQPVWTQVSFIAMAFIALIGGLCLAYISTTSPTAEKTATTQEPLPSPNAHEEISQQKTFGGNKVDQNTSGPGSPAIANTRGNVTITVTNP